MYQELSKEEKKQVRKKYAATKKGKDLRLNLDSLVFEGLFCLATSVVTFVLIFVYHLAWWYWFFVGLCLFCGILFLVGQHLIRMKEYNKFLKFDNKRKKK